MSDGERKLDKYYYDLFFPPTDPKENWSNSKTYYRVAGFASGVFCKAYLGNKLGFARPIAAGLPITLLYGVIGCALSEGIRRTVITGRDYHHRRVFHYMMLHPEDFPPPQRIKFGDYFEEWDSNR